MVSICKYKNEKGFALILALSMLAILSILGVFALNTSTTEVQISGNYNASQQAFIAADRVIATIDAGFNANGEFLNMDLDEERVLAGDYLNRHQNAGLVKDASTVRLVHEEGDMLRNYHYVINLTGGVFPSNVSNEPRQRVRIETKNVALGRLSLDSGTGVGSGSGDYQTRD